MATREQREAAAAMMKPGGKGGAAPANGPRGGPAVIRHVETADEGNRVMKRHVPAFALSGLFHLVFVTVFVLIFGLGGGDTNAKQNDQVIDTVVEEEEEEDYNLTNEDLGFDADLEAAVDVEREEIENVEAPVIDDEPIGIPAEDNFEMPAQTVAPPGALTDSLATPGFIGDAGSNVGGEGGMYGTFVAPGMRGRSGSTKNALLAAGGGNSQSEAAVARGLAWLARQQRPDGSWQFGGNNKGSNSNTVVATGMAMLPFLAAGETHKTGKYKKTVYAAMRYLTSMQTPNGGFRGTKNMYIVPIGALALAELYGMTRDPVLKRNAQAAMNYVAGAQGADGSWGYSAGTNGDTSIVGWNIQALKSGKLSKLIVPDRTMDAARGFLESVSSNSGSRYGYRTPGGRPTLSAVGLLCQVYISNWGPQNPSLAGGVEYLLSMPPRESRFDMYYYYYATQVVHFFGGPDWHKTWNPRMRDMLIKLQEQKKGEFYGSWAPDEAHIGSHCGRIGTTALALLTLEVYYRYLPTYKRGTGGLKDLEG